MELLNGISIIYKRRLLWEAAIYNIKRKQNLYSIKSTIQIFILTISFYWHSTWHFAKWSTLWKVEEKQSIKIGRLNQVILLYSIVYRLIWHPLSYDFEKFNSEILSAILSEYRSYGIQIKFLYANSCAHKNAPQ